MLKYSKYKFKLLDLDLKEFPLNLSVTFYLQLANTFCPKLEACIMPVNETNNLTILATLINNII